MKFNSLLCFTKNNNMNIENDKYTFAFEINYERDK